MKVCVIKTEIRVLRYIIHTHKNTVSAKRERTLDGPARLMSVSFWLILVLKIDLSDQLQLSWYE